MPKQENQWTDIPGDVYWTFDRAALHLGVTRATIERYVREGLPTHYAGLRVHRDELLAEYRRRLKRRLATRAKRTSA